MSKLTVSSSEQTPSLPSDYMARYFRGVKYVKDHKKYEAFLEWTAADDIERARLLNIKKVPNPRGNGERYEKIPGLSDFAKYHGFSRTTLYMWQNASHFQKQVVQMRKDNFKITKNSNAVESLYRRALRYGMASDVELLLAYTEGWSRLQKVEIIKRFSYDDLRYLISLLPQEDQEEFYGLFERFYFKLRAAGARLGAAEPYASGNDANAAISE